MVLFCKCQVFYEKGRRQKNPKSQVFLNYPLAIVSLLRILKASSLFIPIFQKNKRHIDNINFIITSVD